MLPTEAELPPCLETKDQPEEGDAVLITFKRSTGRFIDAADGKIKDSICGDMARYERALGWIRSYPLVF